MGIPLEKMKVLAGLFSASFAYGTTETYSTETTEATTYYTSHRYTHVDDTSTTSSTLGSSWSPLKCGECGCCCRPEHRPHCENGVNLPKEWSCSQGDYLIWNGLEIDISDNGSTQKVETFDYVKSAGKCRSKCDNTDWCEAFSFVTDDLRCILLKVLSLATYDDSAIGNNVGGMKCDHTPLLGPTRNPDDYLWSSCQNHYDQAGENGIGEFIPQCDSKGNWKQKQCNGSTGFCHCVDHHGVEVPGSSAFGTAKCRKVINSKTFSNGRIISFYRSDVPEPYETAVDRCTKVGGTLPVPLNQEENDFLASLGGTWLGFQTDNMDHVDYTNWREGEPNGDGDHVVLMVGKDGPVDWGYGSWNDGLGTLNVGATCYLDRSKGPTKKAESFRDRLTATITTNINGSKSLKERLRKTTGRMIDYFEKNVGKCDYGENDEEEVERTDLMTPCDAAAKLTRKLKNWASKYDINCDESKSGKFLNKMHNQLDFVKSKIEKRLDC